MSEKIQQPKQNGKIFALGTKTVGSLFSFFFLLTVLVAPTFATGLLVTWSPNTEPDLAGYRVYYGTESATYTQMKDVGKVTSCILDGLVIGQTYYVVVTAYDLNNNESAPSLEVSATVAPADISIELVENGIHLRWTALPGADRYEVYSSADPYFLPTSPLASLTTSEYTDPFNPQTPRLARYYVVKAFSGANTIYTYDRVGAFNLTLSYAKNLVSLPLIAPDLSVNSVIGPQLRGATNAAMADKILYWNGRDFEMAWLVDGSGTPYDGKWLTQGGDQISTLSLDPDRSFWIWLRNYPSDSLVTITGKISKDANRVIALQKGINYIGTCYPVSVTLQASELASDNVVRGGKNSPNADKILRWFGDKYEMAWLVDGTGTAWDKKWVVESGAGETQMKFIPGNGYILMLRDNYPQQIWTYPNPNPNL